MNIRKALSAKALIKIQMKLENALQSLQYETKALPKSRIAFWRNRAVYLLDYFENADGIITVWGIAKREREPLKMVGITGYFFPFRTGEIMNLGLSEITSAISAATAEIDADYYNNFRNGQYCEMLASPEEFLESLEFPKALC